MSRSPSSSSSGRKLKKKHRQPRYIDISGPTEVRHIYSYTARDLPEAPVECWPPKDKNDLVYCTYDSTIVVQQLIDSITQKLLEWGQLLEKYNEVDERCNFLDAQTGRYI